MLDWGDCQTDKKDMAYADEQGELGMSQFLLYMLLAIRRAACSSIRSVERELCHVLCMLGSVR